MSKNLCVCVNCAFNLLENSGNSEKKSFQANGWRSLYMQSSMKNGHQNKNSSFFVVVRSKLEFSFPTVQVGWCVLLLLSFFKSFILQCLYCLPSAPLGATSYKFSSHHQLLNWCALPVAFRPTGLQGSLRDPTHLLKKIIFKAKKSKYVLSIFVCTMKWSLSINQYWYQYLNTYKLF